MKRDPKDPRIHLQLAGFWDRHGDFSKAEASLQKAISLNPTAGYHHGLAQLYFRQKRYSQAIDQWKHALDQDPKNFDALFGTGLAYEQLEAWGSALYYYQRALAARPDDRTLPEKITFIKKMAREKRRSVSMRNRKQRSTDQLLNQ